jgi:hypothetical protein
VGKKISVFRENDVEYLKRYLLEAVREVLFEEEEAPEKSIQQGFAPPSEEEEITPSSETEQSVEPEDTNTTEFDAGKYELSGEQIQIIKTAFTFFKKKFPPLAQHGALVKGKGGVYKIVFTNTGNRAVRDVAWNELTQRLQGKIKVEATRKEGEFTLGAKLTAADPKGEEHAVEIWLGQGATAGTSVANRGDVAEGILAAALAARFNNTEGDAEQPLITKADVIKVLEDLDRGKSTSKKKKTILKTLKFPPQETVTEGVKDQVVLIVGLSENNFLDLMNKEKRDSVDDLFDSAVAYANTNEVLDQTLQWYLNDVSNKIEIIADGTSDQKGTKIDVRIKDNNNEIELGKISLKAGATEQLGQIGRKWEELVRLFTLMFGVNISDKYKDTWESAISKDNPDRSSALIRKTAIGIYREAEKQIAQKIAGDDPEEFENFLEQMRVGIQNAATLGEENVKLIHLSNKTFKVLDFGESLKKALHTVQLGVKLFVVPPKGKTAVDPETGEEFGTPYLWIFDKTKAGKDVVEEIARLEKMKEETTGRAQLRKIEAKLDKAREKQNSTPAPEQSNALITLRPKVEEDGAGAIRHYVEKKHWLVELLSIKPREKRKYTRER